MTEDLVSEIRKICYLLEEALREWQESKEKVNSEINCESDATSFHGDQNSGDVNGRL